ncbi:PQQ-binding-like beta-propeller repeat protein [Streptomyces sp. NPDC048603]|uniref:protein kinase domain-containing protein n=1 Tax=Streptomyces sp. NPDC048603 TaxID=3365577 RepID=UPI00371177A2
MALRDGDPRSIGGYVLIDRLGSGGMGTVYSARSASGRMVAVKLVHQQFADDSEFRTRFRQEVAAARRVSGAFTAPVLDADPDAERPWMATLLVPGRTLGSRVKADGPVAGAELRVLALGLVEALRELHTTGLIHRDLKPDNVLLTVDGPRVIDFGISRATGQQTLTATGQILGTPPYMSPEQLSAPHRVTPASDVFSLGSVLVFAATGRGPFDAESHFMTAYRVVSDPPELGPLTGPLRRTLERCLAKDPADRPDPGELLSAFTAAEPADWEPPVAASPAAAEPGAAEAGETGGPAATAGGATPVESTRPSGPPTAPADLPGRPALAGPAGPAAPARPDAAGTRPHRRFLLRTAMASVTAVALIAGAVLYLDPSWRTGARVSGTSGPGTSPSPSSATRSGEDTGVLAAYAPTEGGTPANTNAYADSPERRPAGWQPWSGADGLGPCVYADSSLVCTTTVTSGRSEVTRLDAATGRVRWSVPVDVVDSEGPAVTGDTVVVLGGKGGFLGFALADGKSRWSAPTPHILRRLAADGDRAYAVTLKGEVTALDASVGRLLWKAPPAKDSVVGYPALRASGGRVYVQGLGQNPNMTSYTFVSTLDSAKGTQTTRVNLSDTCEIRGLAVAPAEERTVFLCHGEHRQGVLRMDPEKDAADPEKDASVDIPFGGHALSGLSTASGKIYFAAASISGEPGFTELNQESGGSLWRVPLPEECSAPERPEQANAVVVTGGLAYVRCGPEGRVVDLAARKTVKRFSAPARTDPEGPAGFLVVGGLVFAPSGTGWAAVEPQPL